MAPLKNWLFKPRCNYCRQCMNQEWFIAHLEVCAAANGQAVAARGRAAEVRARLQRQLEKRTSARAVDEAKADLRGILERDAIDNDLRAAAAEIASILENVGALYAEHNASVANAYVAAILDIASAIRNHAAA